jgi:hypothetical protein
VEEAQEEVASEQEDVEEAVEEVLSEAAESD